MSESRLHYGSQYPPLNHMANLNNESNLSILHPCSPAVASTSTSTPDLPQQTKLRASRACASCNRQKLRCDGSNPCSRCVSSQNPCEYLPSLRGKTRKRKKLGDNDAKDGAGQDEDEVIDPDDESDPRLVMWRRDNSFRSHAPTIAALWGEGSGGPVNHRPDLPVITRNRRSNGSLDISEKLTTLPLPGDAHNPLAVLAEASETARSDHDVNSPHTTRHDRPKGQKAEEAGEYYLRLDRELMKDEAPHIMGYIKVHE